MTKIVRRIAVEWKGRDWYLLLNLRHDLVKSSLNIYPLPVFEEIEKSGRPLASECKDRRLTKNMWEPSDSLTC
jgi:hypothetical protein